MISIDYESEGFPAGLHFQNGHGVLETSWHEILWSALTIGRPNLQAVFQNGDSSLYEAIFRLSLVRMALEQRGSREIRLRRTDAARLLDPTEKGAVSYFIGMLLCKLFAARLLDTPWLLHVDSLRPRLNRFLATRSRPDLYGQRNSGEWIVMESKGLVAAPHSSVKTRAKQQADRFPSSIVAPDSIQFRIGGITYLKRDVLQFYWRDPEPEREPPYTSARFDPSLWRFHWALALALDRAARHDVALRFRGDSESSTYAEYTDVRVTMQPTVRSLLDASRWADART